MFASSLGIFISYQVFGAFFCRSATGRLAFWQSPVVWVLAFIPIESVSRQKENNSDSDCQKRKKDFLFHVYSPDLLSHILLDFIQLLEDVGQPVLDLLEFAVVRLFNQAKLTSYDSDFCLVGLGHFVMHPDEGNDGDHRELQQ
jgi:hypothetical protein